MALDDAGALAELQVTQRIFDDRLQIDGAGDVEAGEMAEHLGVGAIL
ncbi:MAG: hypothetical protein J2P53_16805 [Bradyrhizobiaceae bacterium]|nr:hypothetical protein [Bradyrhizobiaceae bacterium]